jgi:hypothetical protein
MASPSPAAPRVRRNILDCVGGTSLVPLSRIVPATSARVLLKLESENPTGSMKDRMALAMIGAARADGRLLPGGTVVEYTGGSTGVSLALVAAVLGYPLHIVSSDAFAREKLEHMRRLGANLHVVPSDGGRMTEQLTHEMIRTAGGIARDTGAFWTDQLKNVDQLAAYHTLGEEILAQTDGQSRRLRPGGRQRGIAARRIRDAAATPRGRHDRGGRAGGICRPVRRSGRCAQDRRHRRRIRRTALAGRTCRSHRTGVNRRGLGDGGAARR